MPDKPDKTGGSSLADRFAARREVAPAAAIEAAPQLLPALEAGIESANELILDLRGLIHACVERRADGTRNEGVIGNPADPTVELAQRVGGISFRTVTSNVWGTRAFGMDDLDALSLITPASKKAPGEYTQEIYGAQARIFQTLQWIAEVGKKEGELLAEVNVVRGGRQELISKSYYFKHLPGIEAFLKRAREIYTALNQVQSHPSLPQPSRRPVTPEELHRYFQGKYGYGYAKDGPLLKLFNEGELVRKSKDTIPLKYDFFSFIVQMLEAVKADYLSGWFAKTFSEKEWRKEGAAIDRELETHRQLAQRSLQIWDKEKGRLQAELDQLYDAALADAELELQNNNYPGVVADGARQMLADLERLQLIYEEIESHASALIQESEKKVTEYRRSLSAILAGLAGAK